MTIDEAIAIVKEQAKYQNSKYDKCQTRMLYCCEMCFHNPKCNEVAEQCEQLAEWLEELKDYQDKNKMVVRVDCENMDSIRDKIDELSKYAESQYNKAIYDFSNILKENYDYLPQILSQEAFDRYIDEYGEQLKEGVNINE